MELSKRTQKIIATVCGVVLFGIIVVLVLRHFAPNFSLSLQPPSMGNDTQRTATTEGETKTAPSKDVTTAEKKTEKPAANTQDYTYTAAAGDSYTLFARDAVQQYAKAHDLTVSYDQALQAEATLAGNAGSPLLEIGQQITIAQTAVATALGIETTVATSSDNAASSTDSSAKSPSEDYTYTAASGDSYTALARTAISSYASKNKLNLTSAQRIAAETNLAAVAGTPELAIGQVITFATASLKSATDAAKSLSANELAAWQPYATLAGL